MTSNSDESSEGTSVDVDPRVQFAAERTLLAWVRTGLAMMGFGFVVARFGLFLRELVASRGATPVEHVGLSRWVGTALVALGVLVNVAAAIQYGWRMRTLARGQTLRPRAVSLGTVVAVVLAALGLLMAVYLLTSG